MSERAVEPTCPACARALAPEGEGARCASCRRAFASTGGVLDLRTGALPAPAPWPLSPAELEGALERLDGGGAFREAFEELLLELDDVPASRLMQLVRESRGAWLPVLKTTGGRALFLGNGLSGAPVPLAACGFHVTFLDPSPLRARLGRHHKQDRAPGRTRALVGGDGPRLPFADRAFDLVVQEDGLPRAQQGWGHDLAELRRVSAGEVLLVADNRLAYKRSSAVRGVFHVPGPLAYLRRALRPARGERTLAGYRRALAAPGWRRARANALYPHAHEFAFVVGLDGRGPHLLVGPQERRNRAKVLAQRSGLFPLLTPSFALVAERAELAGAPLRVDGLLAELARATGEPTPELDQLVATRGNTCVLLTRLPGRGEDDPRGRWCVHLPLSPAQREQIQRHHAVLGRIRREHPGVPVPEPLFEGTLGGVYLSCERRVGGLNAPQLTGDRRAAAATYADVARHLAQLVVEPARACDAARFEQQVERRLAPALAKAHVASTADRIARERERLRERLVGRSFPLVLYHADLRSKHLQVRPDGRVLAYLDWGTTEPAGLPYFDLLHLIAHDRKQEAGLPASEAWRIVRDPALLRPHERAALDEYARLLGLDAEYRAAIADAYPLFVAAMAEANWDYSRPRWLHRNFGV